ncbi:MAG: hypothetical protein ACOCQR_03015 [bacterium]
MSMSMEEFEMMDELGKIEQECTYIAAAIKALNKLGKSEFEKKEYIVRNMEEQINVFTAEIYPFVKQNDLDYFERLAEYVELKVEKYFQTDYAFATHRVERWVDYMEVALKVFDKYDIPQEKQNEFVIWDIGDNLNFFSQHAKDYARDNNYQDLSESALFERFVEDKIKERIEKEKNTFNNIN